MAKTIARVAITQSEFFADWPATAIERLVAAAEVERYEDGAVIYRPGDAPDHAYLIAAGALRIIRQGRSGRKFTSLLLFAGDSNSLGSVISETPHIHMAACKGETQLVLIPGALIREILRKDGKLALAVFAGFYQRYQHALHLYETASTRAVRARIAGLLQSLVRRRRRQTTALELSQDEIAEMLGTRRQVVNRELRAMEGAGAVRVEYGRITIVDAAALNKLAAGPD